MVPIILEVDFNLNFLKNWWLIFGIALSLSSDSFLAQADSQFYMICHILGFLCSPPLGQLFIIFI